ncbi:MULTISPECIES: hypothetical protein [unclassified Acinetobacter]|uniref:hypothetical protein n=1 Tax=unclassified Acinetobacter TaxID=196816 RepID=UPI001D0E3B9C|nr:MULTISPECIES: hypothetical protein [unclassified Acinetobacter]
MLKTYPQRYITASAIYALAQRFNLPYDPFMQDWEYEVADPNRIDEFIDAYLSNELNEDEKFALMETILQSFEESSKTLDSDQQWNIILQLLEDNLDIHATTICYWAYGNSAYTLCWRITPDLRKIKRRNHLKIIQEKEILLWHIIINRSFNLPKNQNPNCLLIKSFMISSAPPPIMLTFTSR